MNSGGDLGIDPDGDERDTAGDQGDGDRCAVRVEHLSDKGEQCRLERCGDHPRVGVDRLSGEHETGGGERRGHGPGLRSDRLRREDERRGGELH